MFLLVKTISPENQTNQIQLMFGKNRKLLTVKSKAKTKKLQSDCQLKAQEES
jgi:hypothetical protein